MNINPTSFYIISGILVAIILFLSYIVRNLLMKVEKYEDEGCEDKELALIELGQLVFKSNYYSQKLTSETENEEAKKDLVSSLRFLNITDAVIAAQVVSMDTPKYARFDMSEEEALHLISSWG